MKEHLLGVLHDAHRARAQGMTAIIQRQRARLHDLVDFTRTNSPYYHTLYQDLPEYVEDPQLLPVTNKQKLMAHFDDWSTDREIKREQVLAFVENPEMIGERYLNKYLVTTTSGTTGNRGIFLMDDRAMMVNLALTLPMMGSWLGPRDVLKLLSRGGRMAVVVATGGHFLVAAGATRLRKIAGWLGHTIQFFSVHMPMSEMVAQLNQFQPGVVIGYASMIALLASEQEAGRLQIKPALLEPAGETLTAGEYKRIARIFNARVRNVYGATECPFLSSDCTQGWYHINNDWTVLEPVDAEYQPVQPGKQSHTVLLSNLANRLQPILRYDLGDSVLQKPDPCPCGNPLPAIRVQGRAADVLTFPGEDEKPISIAPLVFGTLIDRTPGIELFQIVQTAPTNLRVHIKTTSGSDPDQVWQAVQIELTQLLAKNMLKSIRIERAAGEPEQSPGGKYRTIIPLH